MAFENLSKQSNKKAKWNYEIELGLDLVQMEPTSCNGTQLPKEAK